MDGPARVAIDVTPLVGARTGIGMFVSGLMRELGRADERTSVAVTPFAMTWRGRGATSATHRPMPARPLRWLWARANHPSIERWIGPHDVVHGTNYVVPPSSGAAELVSVHDLTSVHHPQLCSPDVRQFPGLVRRALQRGAWVHADSRFVADEIIEWSGVEPERVRVVHLAVDGGVERLAADRSRSPEISGGAPFLLALGTIEPRKDHAALVRAFSLLADDLPEHQLLVAGQKGTETGRFDAALAALTPAVRGRVRLLGYVDDNERADLLRAADVLVYPSVYEGFGLPPLEAMAVGVPVVATSVGALPEVLGDGADLVASGDDQALAAAIGKVVGDDRHRHDLISRGLRRVEHFSWDRCTGGLVELYNDLAAGVRRAGRRP